MNIQVIKFIIVLGYFSRFLLLRKKSRMDNSCESRDQVESFRGGCYVLSTFYVGDSISEPKMPTHQMLKLKYVHFYNYNYIIIKRFI